jgi:hypothetical protein
MAQEFTIKSQEIEDKINQLLPSQGGFQAGVDFSASTMVIPIVDLTETAEGSSLRQDLQKALSLTSVTTFNVNNTTSIIINTTGYFRVFGRATLNGSADGNFSLTDGTTTKQLLSFNTFAGTYNSDLFDFIVFLEAGDSLTCTSGSTEALIGGATRQLADISGNLINP